MVVSAGQRGEADRSLCKCDSNLQREQLTPSEKAYAYKMKYEAIKKKAGRKNCGNCF